MEKKDVFISYKSEEYDQAMWVKTALETNGISCWMAPMSIPGGSSYANEIPTAIRNCRVFVLILSEKAQLSKWVPRELDQAINESKIVMPFMLENCALKDDFNFYLTNVQRYEAFQNKSKTIEKMVNEIKAILAESESSMKSVAKETDTPAKELKAEPLPEPAVQQQKKADSSVKSEKEQKPVVKSKSEKSSKKAGKKTSSRKKGKALKVFAAVIAALIVVVIAFSVMLSKAGTVTIAGEDFAKNSFFVSLEEKELTTDELDKLSRFERLTTVTFKNCTLPEEDISKFLPENLSTLELINCGLTDKHLASVDFETHKKIHNLDISGNSAITDLSPLLPLKDSLVVLNVSGTSVKSLDSISGFSSVTNLAADNTGLTDIWCLSELIWLEKLSLSGNELESLAGLENTSLLEYVNLNNNKISDVRLLASSHELLQKLYLDNNNISDMSPLSRCTRIEYLSVDNNKIDNLLWLTNFTELEKLSAAGNQITGAAGLKGSAKLCYLDLSDNKLTSVSENDISFSEADNIRADFRNNEITSISLPTTCSYNHLALCGNPLKDVSLLSEIKGINVYFDYSPEADVEFLNSTGFSWLYITNCPLDKQVPIDTKVPLAKLITQEEAENQLAEKFALTPDVI